VATKLYQEIKLFVYDGDLFGNKQLLPLQLMGPKGVGKSTSLYAIAIALDQKQSKKLTPLYFSEKSFSSSFRNKYLKYHSIPGKLSDHFLDVSGFIKSQKQTFFSINRHHSINAPCLRIP